MEVWDLKVDNAIIMAAGISSRFVPLSYEKPKALFEVKGEILIERQIRQLKEAGISQIYIITGYKAEQFEYLQNKFGNRLIYNPEYNIRNNHSSIWAARNVLKNSYVCSADNYFTQNPFEREVDEPYYAAKYAGGFTEEWCMEEDEEGYIKSVSIGGSNSWYMLGHTFWSEIFSQKFIDILQKEYNYPETVGKLWEKIFISHLDVLKMKIRKYDEQDIFEFDTLDELRDFDESYKNNTRSAVLRRIATKLAVKEKDITHIVPIKTETQKEMVIGFSFDCNGINYTYTGDITNGRIDPKN